MRVLCPTRLTLVPGIPSQLSTSYPSTLAAEPIGQGAGRHQQTVKRQHEGVGDPGQRCGAAAECTADGGRGYRPS